MKQQAEPFLTAAGSPCSPGSIAEAAAPAFDLDAAGICTWEMDLLSGEVKWSRNAEILFGLPPDSPGTTSSDFLDRLHPEDRERFSAATRRMAGGAADGSTREFNLEFRVIWPDRSVHWLAARGQVFHDDAGTPTRMVGVAVDVCRRKEVEEALRKSEARLQHLLSYTPAVVYSVSAEGDRGATFVSDNVSMLVGFEPYHFLENPRFWDSRVHPEDYEVLSHSESIFERNQIVHEYRFLHRDGEYRWIHDEVRLIRDEAGNPVECVGSWIGITTRKNAEEALRRSEARFRALIENSSDGIALLDADGSVVYLSHGTRGLLGHPADHPAIGRPEELLHPEDLGCARALFMECLEQPGNVLTGDFRYRHADGSWRNLESTIVNRLDDPAVRAVVSNYRDITPRKQAEQALQQSHTLLNAVVEGTTDAVYVKDIDSRYLMMNSAGAAVMQKTAEEVVGCDDPSLFSPEEALRIRAADRRVMESGTPETYEDFYNAPDGRHVYLTTKAPYRDLEGNIIGVVGISRDITERTRMEEALSNRRHQTRMALSAARAGIWDLNMRTKEARWVEGASLIDEVLTPDKVQTYQTLLEEIHPDDREGVKQAIEQAFEGDGEYEREFRTAARDGSIRWVAAKGTVVPDEQGELVRLTGVSMDISDRKRTEAELAKSQEQLLQAQKMEAIGRLAGGVAHDFNNMLSVINGYSELLLHHVGLPAPLRSPLEEIKKAGERSAVLTQQLLAFSRKQMITPRVLDLNEVVVGTETMLNRLIGEDIELVTGRQPGLHKVMVDRAQIEQALVNLAVNARDAMPGGGRLSIRTRNADFTKKSNAQRAGVPPGRYVEIVISDTGSGMEPVTLEHIFEPFFTTKDIGKGTGLGLSTVLGIVKQNGGEVRAESKAGQGTTFTIHLPAVEDAEGPDWQLEAPRQAPACSGTILLVEDEPLVRRLTYEVLRSTGYEVLEAANAGDALLVCKEHPGRIDLLLTDVVMPGMSGPDLAAALQSFRPETRVIYMSGYAQETVLDRRGSAAETAFIQKPFKPDFLISKVQEVLR